MTATAAAIHLHAADELVTGVTRKSVTSVACLADESVISVNLTVAVLTLSPIVISSAAIITIDESPSTPRCITMIRGLRSEAPILRLVVIESLIHRRAVSNVCTSLLFVPVVKVR